MIKRTMLFVILTIITILTSCTKKTEIIPVKVQGKEYSIVEIAKVNIGSTQSIDVTPIITMDGNIDFAYVPTVKDAYSKDLLNIYILDGKSINNFIISKSQFKINEIKDITIYEKDIQEVKNRKLEIHKEIIKLYLKGEK
ncbi:MAG: hypothetical protein FWC41_12020 [Firmicutes bacterium]|nr:hypothetical protein [Bacillota bacterium]